jgi:hypothetical protein
MSRSRPTTLEPLTPALFVVVALHAALAVAVWWACQEARARSSATPLAWMRPSDFKDSLPPVKPRQEVPRAIPIASAPKKAPPVAPLPKIEPPPAAPKKTTEPAVAKATLISPPKPPEAMSLVEPGTSTPLFAGAAVPKTAANRSITLRRSTPKPPPIPPPDAPPPPPAKSASLADMARLSTLRPQAAEPPPMLATDPAAGINMDAVDNAVNAAFYAQWTAPALDAVPETQRSAQLTISVARDGTVASSQMSRPSGSHALDDSILAALAKVKKIDATLPSQFPKDRYDLDITFLLLP